MPPARAESLSRGWPRRTERPVPRFDKYWAWVEAYVQSSLAAAWLRGYAGSCLGFDRSPKRTVSVCQSRGEWVDVARRLGVDGADPTSAGRLAPVAGRCR
jgi:hypothetical protein